MRLLILGLVLHGLHATKSEHRECKQHFRKCNPERTGILKCVNGHYELIKCESNKSCTMRFRVTACR